MRGELCYEPNPAGEKGKAVMIYTLEELYEFASENNLSPEHAFHVFSFASFICGMITLHLIEEILKSLVFQKILKKVKYKFKQK